MYGRGGTPRLPDACRACGAVARNDEGEVVSFRPRQALDVYGEHALVCLRNAASIRRHNAVAAAIRRTLEAAGISASTANKAVFDKGYRRPADVMCPEFPGHTAGLAIDVTIVSAAVPGTSVAGAEAEKRKKYADYLPHYPGLGFTPFALDSSGGIGESAWGLMGRLARIISEKPSNLVDFGAAKEMVLQEIAWTFGCEISREISSSAELGNYRRRHRCNFGARS